MSKKSIIGIVIILVLVILLFVVRGSKSKPVDIDQPNTTSKTPTDLGNDFVVALVGVQRITLDTKFLKTQTFQSLESSGALINRTPLRGKIDPFSKFFVEKKINEDTIEDPPTRITDLGKPDPLLNSAVKISKITTTTATISVSGIPDDELVSVSITDKNGKTINLNDFTYKTVTSEYVSIATSLSPKTNYTVYIKTPSKYLGLQAQFDTK